MQPESLQIDRHPRSRARTSGATPQHPLDWRPPGHRSRGRAALPATPTPAPERGAAAAGRYTPRRSRGTLKDGRRRPKPCGDCTPAAAPHRRRTARDARETRALGPGQNGWTRLQPALTHAHTGGTRGLKTLCSLAHSLAGKKKGLSTLPRTLAITDRGDRIRTCDLVLPKHPRYQAAPRPVDGTVAVGSGAQG